MGKSQMNPPQEKVLANAIRTLRKRSEFVAMRSGSRQHAKSFLLQMRGDSANSFFRIGYTVTKKTGNAVERNRIRRRLRAAVKIVMPSHGRPAHDYVLIGKRAALNVKFETLIAELGITLTRLHKTNT